MSIRHSNSKQKKLSKDFNNDKLKREILSNCLYIVTCLDIYPMMKIYEDRSNQNFANKNQLYVLIISFYIRK